MSTNTTRHNKYEVSRLISLSLVLSLCTVMYTSARARFGGFSRQDLLSDLELLDQIDERVDEREVPLLADTDEVEQTAVPLVENVIVVDEKEVPTNIPEASEIV